MRSIDIDVGGTFTDFVFRDDERVVIAKAPTTPYDLSVGFMNAVEEGAKKLGLTAAELLQATEVIRYATTVAMNQLIQRKGIRLGLIVTEGHEDMVIIGRGAQWVDGTRVAERRNLSLQWKPEPLVPRSLTVGASERVDSAGRVVRPLDEDDIREKIRQLVDRGVRGFVVSLLWSIANPIHEQRIKEIIREEYKDFHVGYLPVVLASDVLGKQGEYERTMTAILDAYLQSSLRNEISWTWDKLRENGYGGSFLLVHNSGGCADVFKTTASRTYNAGPVAGLMGSYYLARELGYRNVVATDVGGTSFDIGLVVEENVRVYEFRPIIDRWMVGITMLQTLSIGAGGGSIAKINRLLGNRLEVGPESAGSLPGPACYSLGGTEPTVTDADVVLGYIDPAYYHGGKIKLDSDRAWRTIRAKIAKPLGIEVPEAALAIRTLAEQNMASAIHREVNLRGYRPDDFVLFAYGGGGPTHVAGYMGDIPRAVLFPFSPVFSAYGSSITDIVHLYEKSRRMPFMEPGTMRPTEDYDSFNRVVDELIADAKKDLAAEGLDPDSALFSLELDMFYGGQVHVKRTASPRLFLREPEDVQAVYQQFEREFSESFSPLVVNPEGGVFIENFILRTTVPTAKLRLPVYSLEGKDPRASLKGKRRCYWGNGWYETPVYDLVSLRPGNVVQGPAIAESEYTTAVVPPDYSLTVDQHGLAVLTRKEI